MKDPNLVSDTCVYLEAIANDGGTHDPNAAWYLSPDLDLVDSNGTQTNTAKAGEAHKVRVKVRNKDAGCSFGNNFNSANDKIRVEAYVTLASLAIDINNSSQSKLIGTKDVAPSDVDTGGYKLTADHFVPLNWTPGTDSTKANGPGHRCLVARCYPTNLDPSNKLFLPDDPHIVQHNIDIITVPAGSPVPMRMYAVPNANPINPAGIEIKVNPILAPSEKLQTYLKELLRVEPDFREFAILPNREIQKLEAMGELKLLQEKLETLIPKGFNINMQEPLPALRLRDFSRPKTVLDTRKRLYPKRFLAEFRLEPQQLTFFEFTPEPFQSKPGTSHIFNLVQYDNGEPTGGMLVVYIVTD